MLLRVSALVFVGDAMEENSDTVAHEANELGRLGVPAFMFQEGHDREVEHVFREIARLSHGAYCPILAPHANSLSSYVQWRSLPLAG